MNSMIKPNTDFKAVRGSLTPLVVFARFKRITASALPVSNIDNDRFGLPGLLDVPIDVKTRSRKFLRKVLSEHIPREIPLSRRRLKEDDSLRVS
ncbi:hypothetical protein PUN28_011771 [Cardiocondyla obscurior]|uniref:Uncharacterized protein n=1 Tax=Cardiocondyla obscurior TaxID=286306 RepID=A0AAW2FGY5_9HYME